MKSTPFDQYNFAIFDVTSREHIKNMSKKINIDLSYPSTVRPRQTSVPVEGVLCPYHEKLKNNKGKNSQLNKDKNQKMIGVKNSLERKLNDRGIKLKVKCQKRKVQPLYTQTDEINDKKFTASELSCLSNQQLQFIINTFEEKIKFLSNELTEMSEENERHTDDMEGLTMTVNRLEELALRVMKPWVNNMPHSDEMTRVMLLN